MHEEAFLMSVLQDHREAVLTCRLLGAISQTWDDLIDRDKPISDERINDAFTDALLRLPAISFYRENIYQLHPLLRQAVIDWQTATHFERNGNAHDKTLAFVLRDSLVALVTHCAFLVGGHSHACKVAPEIRRYFHNESIQHYIGGLT